MVSSNDRDRTFNILDILLNILIYGWGVKLPNFEKEYFNYSNHMSPRAFDNSFKS